MQPEPGRHRLIKGIQIRPQGTQRHAHPPAQPSHIRVITIIGHSYHRNIAGRQLLDAAETLTDLLIPPGNRLEKLTGDRAGQYSIRINQQWRICFVWSDAGPEDVEIVDYH